MCEHQVCGLVTWQNGTCRDWRMTGLMELSSSLAPAPVGCRETFEVQSGVDARSLIDKMVCARGGGMHEDAAGCREESAAGADSRAIFPMSWLRNRPFGPHC